MSNVSILKGLKEAIYCLYDSNGNKRARVIGSIGKKKLDKSRIGVLYELTDFILKYNAVSECTMLYITDRNISIRGVSEAMKERYDKDISENSVIGKVMYDKRKLDASLGSDIIFKIVHTSSDLEYDREKIKGFKAKALGSSGIREEFIIPIESTDIKTSYDGDFVDDYMEVLTAYSRSTVDIVKRTLDKDKEFTGYFNYLTSATVLKDEKEIADREKLIRVLKGTFRNESTEIIEEDYEEERGDTIEGTDSYIDDDEIVI